MSLSEDFFSCGGLPKRQPIPESTSQHVSLSVLMTTHWELWGLKWMTPTVSQQRYTDLQVTKHLTC